MNALLIVQQQVAGHMEDIQSLFKKGAKITVLVRTPDKPDSDFLMTDDNLDEVVAAVQRRKAAGATA